MTELANWHITGDWFDNCSCTVACPCTFAQAPDNGFCELAHPARPLRRYQSRRSELRPGGKMKAISGRGRPRGVPASSSTIAPKRQAEVLPRIFSGQAGGFPALVAALFAEGRQLRGVERARITFEIASDRAQWGTEIAGKVKAWAKALTGPTSPPG